MLYLSYDIANRSLAFTLMFFDKKKLAEEILSKEILIIHDAISRNVNVIACEVHDLTDGVKLKNSSKAKRTLNLKTLLRRIEEMVGTSKVKVLLEFQMSINKKANVIFNQIYYHFAEHHPITIKPCYKNMFSFKEELSYRYFSERYKNSYCANKSHSKANFIYFFESFGLREFLKPIQKKNLDDAADSFMQIFAYINYYSHDRIFTSEVKNLQTQ